jgi:hypothetical protein
VAFGLPIGGLIMALLFCSAMLGMLIARLLPAGHLSPETRKVVTSATAVVGTLSALVVGLLISSASTSFNAKSNEVTQIATDSIRLDRVLGRYGPETQGVRLQLRRYAEATEHDLFPPSRAEPVALENAATMNLLESVETAIVALAPADDERRLLKGQALDLTGALAATRWRLVQEEANRTPLPLMILVLFWFVVIFTGFGLFAPRHVTAVVAIMLCAVGVGSAIRMVTEFQTPFQGMARISSASIVHALDMMDRQAVGQVSDSR